MKPKQIEKQMQALHNAHEDAIAAVEEYGTKCSELAAEVRGYMEGRSESWQESERGQAYEAFESNLEHIEQLCSFENVPELGL